MINPIYQILYKRNLLPTEQTERAFYEMQNKERENMNTLFEKLKNDFSEGVLENSYDYRSRILIEYWNGYKIARITHGKNPIRTGLYFAQRAWLEYIADETIMWQIKESVEEWLESLSDGERTPEKEIMIYYFVERMCKYEFCSYMDLLFYIKGLS